MFCYMWTKTRVSCFHSKIQKFLLADKFKISCQGCKKIRGFCKKDSYRKNLKVVNRQYSENIPGSRFQSMAKIVAKIPIEYRQSRDHATLKQPQQRQQTKDIMKNQRFQNQRLLLYKKLNRTNKFFSSHTNQAFYIQLEVSYLRS